jgi:ABC-2 type transport system permease protein
MTILMNSVMSGLSVVWDREFGFLKEIMVAPISRVAIVLGKTVSGSLTALLQGTIVLALFPLLHLRLSPLQITLAILGMWLTALAICSLGVLIASRMTSFEGFGTVNNFLVMPLFFLSGAMYPTQGLPGWLKVLVHANPVTYSVNLLRGVVLRQPGDHLLGISVILAFTLVVSSVSVLLFSLEGKGVK